MMKKIKLSSVLFHALMIALSFVMIYPLLWIVASSFKESKDIFVNSHSLMPSLWNFNNYIEGWKGFVGLSFTVFYKNTIWLVCLQTIGSVASAVLVAYGFARVRFYGSKALFGIMMLTMMLPYQVLMIPQFVLFHKIGWVNTYLPLIVPAFTGRVFDIFLVMQFIKGIPYDMDEAAKIDGCGEFKRFYKIILPLITPAVVTVFIFNFYQRWDDFMGPLIYLNSPEKYPISLAIRSFADSASATNWGAMFAMAVLSIIPIIIIYFFAQDQITEGISTTGLKG